VLEDVAITVPRQECERYAIMVDIPRGSYRGRVEIASAATRDGVLDGVKMPKFTDYEIAAG